MTPRPRPARRSARSSPTPTGEAVEGFGAAVKQAGQSAGDGKGMWQDSTFEDLVQYNDGFRTGLIGTPEQIAERIVAYKRLGVDLLLLGFLHYHEEVEYFGRRVLPLVRELEAQLPRERTRVRSGPRLTPVPFAGTAPHRARGRRMSTASPADRHS